jgi:hypothetical protein
MASWVARCEMYKLLFEEEGHLLVHDELMEEIDIFIPSPRQHTMRVHITLEPSYLNLQLMEITIIQHLKRVPHSYRR